MSSRSLVASNSDSSSDRDRAFELLISRLLQSGVVTSLLMIVFGVTLTFVHHPTFRSDPRELPRMISARSDFPHSIPAVCKGVVQMRGESIAAAGLLLLVGTPVARVAVSLVVFTLQRDWAYTLITAIVLGLLLLSFILGKAEGSGPTVDPAQRSRPASGKN